MRVEATYNGVRSCLQRLHLPGLSGAARSRIEIVLAEVLNNVVEHARIGHPDIRIDLEIELGRHDVRVRLCDTGAPMPGLRLPDGAPANLDVAGHALPEGGFGWNLIRQLACELRYLRDGDRNILTFRVPADHQAQTGRHRRAR